MNKIKSTQGLSLSLLYPTEWSAYQLLDSGNGEKLEQFGNIITIRPEPQAMWDKTWSDAEWKQRAHVRFEQKGSHNGKWLKLKNCADKWNLWYESPQIRICFNLSLTSFKHVGIFPEQATNWEYIVEKISNYKGSDQPKVLNLFAYTGGASLAAKSAGADVTHVDSIKQVINWSNENMVSSGLKDIRWVVEDAFKFVKREVKRGKKYNGIILDPPAYGIGASGERWKLDEQINDMLKEIKALLHEQHFMVLNMYSLGMSALITENLTKQIFTASPHQLHAEVFLPSQSGQKLPLGIVARVSSY
jgi:23S rRNA (cytosine1962-C5)-methyltransferase